ncbi:divalent-cation tolerance protein CutA [Desulfobaculum sp. SPO524]|uniref:divalent-cation tolerance protein CutA n=1 Tax=Desulfobaculum sp. SPO524 TaxID=3378071 RepID=UPI003853B010
MDTILVYMTASDAEEARRIGAVLVERRLAACVNILGTIQSMFWWDGAVQDEGETAFIAKTRRSRFEELARAVREVHSYDTPCIIAMPVAAGDPQFLGWIAESTTPDSTPS